MSHVTSISKYQVPLAKGKMWFCSAALLLGIVMCSQDALASSKMCFGPRGFESQYHTIASIQSHGRDDEIVVLRGRLTNYLYKDSYEFTDENGATIEVELDDDVDWSYVHKDQLIEIMGEVERNMFKIKIEAKNYRILETSAVARARDVKEDVKSEVVSEFEHNGDSNTANIQTDKQNIDDTSNIISVEPNNINPQPQEQVILPEAETSNSPVFLENVSHKSQVQN